MYHALRDMFKLLFYAIGYLFIGAAWVAALVFGIVVASVKGIAKLVQSKRNKRKARE